MSNILTFALADANIAEINILPMLYFWQAFAILIMFPGNSLTHESFFILYH